MADLTLVVQRHRLHVQLADVCNTEWRGMMGQMQLALQLCNLLMFVIPNGGKRGKYAYCCISRATC